jgi:16S rRNA (uracil1498-N3)-methyltransferase
MPGEPLRPDPVLREATALIYVADLADPVPSPDDAHHLGAARRLRDGELVMACDGAGSYVACRSRVDGRDLRLEPDGAVRRMTAPSPRITIGFSLAKGDRTEWAVAKLTELGADRIIPLLCERTVVRPDDGGGRRAGRLRRIARESAMQSRRAWLPEVDEPTPFATAARLDPSAALAEPGGGRLTLDHATVLVGPEGGWSPAERSLGLNEVTLGPAILRIETAAISSATLLIALRSGLVAGGRGAHDAQWRKWDGE